LFSLAEASSNSVGYRRVAYPIVRKNDIVGG
jgi:hypothetical protein